MNENEFKEIIPENKTENFSISDEQKFRLSELYSDYRFRNSVPKRENFFTNHHVSFMLALSVVSIAIFICCIVYDINNAPAQNELPAISDKNSVENNIDDKNSDDKDNDNDNEIGNEEAPEPDTREDIPKKENKPEIPHVINGNAPKLEFSEADLSDADSKYIDSNGKYTTEGIALAVRPSIVEIFTYSDNALPGSGSGIIMTDDGYIITNAHVIDSASSLEVITADNSKYTGEIIGKDNKTDLAVIKIEAKNLTPAQFGDSDNVLLGEQVMAIGNPGGLTGSITGGFVSGLNRKIKTDMTGFEMNCIQTDAAISPGNSGGALVNMYGQVIGITSSKYVSSSFEGLGFAITTQDAKPIIDELLANGYVSGRYKIGINFYAGESAVLVLKQEKNLDFPKDTEGILITNIDKECDISTTELKEFDIITEIEGKKISDYNSLVSALDGKGADDTVKAHIIRVLDSSGNIKEFDILFRLMPDTSGDY